MIETRGRVLCRLEPAERTRTARRFVGKKVRVTRKTYQGDQIWVGECVAVAQALTGTISDQLILEVSTWYDGQVVPQRHYSVAISTSQIKKIEEISA